jgi:tetratricopeptide (TPR) repeat protein
MSNDTFVQPKLGDLIAGFLSRQAETRAAGIATVDGEVMPYEVGPVQPLDPKLAWDESLTALAYCGQSAPARMKAPPHWAQLVAGHESIVAIAFAVGNFPQLMRNFHAVLTLPNLAEVRPTPGRPAPADDLLPWANQIAEKKKFPEMLLAAGALRLARHFEEAEKFVFSHDAGIPAEWREAWENEKAALAWHQGRADDARRLWDSLGDSVPVLFNRGMAALFSNDLIAAKKHLSAAVAKLPSSSAWHHLGRLYLTLTDLRRS